MIVKKLIEKIEGDAELDLHFTDGVVDDARIRFGLYRGIEEILVGKAPRDALVITPRVCGICNHAHLIAAVEALGSSLRSSGLSVAPSPKAEAIRTFTLFCELIQNHLKWLYLTILPQLEAMQYDISRADANAYALKAAHGAQLATKALAIFGGQWPHSAYAVPGGVTCDPTYREVLKAEGMVEELIAFYEKEVIGMPLESFLTLSSISQWDKIGGDLSKVLHIMEDRGINNMGRSHDRFIAFGKNGFFCSGKSIITKVYEVDPKFVRESLQDQTMAKAVSYKGKQFETGPLARAMVRKEPLIKSMHRQYKDAASTRIFARVHEVAPLLMEAKSLLSSLNLSEPSCTFQIPKKIPDGDGAGIVEAARGSLIHTLSIRRGVIADYQIIVPTQWNLSLGTPQEKGVAVSGMIGCSSYEEASLVFRSFDVCSVCTTQ